VEERESEGKQFFAISGFVVSWNLASLVYFVHAYLSRVQLYVCERDRAKKPRPKQQFLAKIEDCERAAD